MISLRKNVTPLLISLLFLVIIPVAIAQTQKALYPDYNTSPAKPDSSGMKSNAVQLAAKMKLGWNFGNTMEAIGGETAWGNPRITREQVALVKKSGFNAIRIPCSWDQNMSNSTKAKISIQWLDRVKEVVQYCVDQDMYVLLNIHWDGGWLENNCTPDRQEANNAKQKAFWEQIATHLRGFDEHLIFCSANEPNAKKEWNDPDEKIAERMEVLYSYHQTFIDAVRSTGGRNSYRVLVVQGPNTDIELTNKFWTKMPIDKVPNRLMAEVHYYTPWNFCGMEKDESWGKVFYYWGKPNHSTTDTERNPTWGEEETVDKLFKLMKSQFADKGIPVILGEFGATPRRNLKGEALELHNKSRAYYLYYVTKKAIENGLIPFYWDSGGAENHSGGMEIYTGSGLFNRTALKVFDQQALDALIKGGTE